MAFPLIEQKKCPEGVLITSVLNNCYFRLATSIHGGIGEREADHRKTDQSTEARKLCHLTTFAQFVQDCAV